MLVSIYLLLASITLAEQSSAPRETVFDTNAAAGNYWGLAPQEAAFQLSASSSPEKQGLSSEWYLAAALENLSGRVSRKSRRMELAGGGRILASSGRTFGYMAAADASDLEYFEKLAQKHFGEKKIVHLQFDPPQGLFDLPRFVHCLVWGDSKSNFALMTATPKRGVIVRHHPETGLETRVEILHKKDDSSIPLYLFFWDSRRPS